MASEQIAPGWGGQEVGDLGGCGGGGVQLGLRGGFWVPGVPAGGPAVQTAGNKAGLQHANTETELQPCRPSFRSDQTKRDVRPRTEWGQWAAFFSRERTMSDQHTQNGHTHTSNWTHAHARKCMHTSWFTHADSVSTQAFLHLHK